MIDLTTMREVITSFQTPQPVLPKTNGSNTAFWIILICLINTFGVLWYFNTCYSKDQSKYPNKRCKLLI